MLIEHRLPTKYQKDKFSIPKELLKGVQSKFDEKELHIQEERRLFYVAITRAKEKLIITYAKRYGENKTDSKPSRFLTEIDYQQNENIDFQQADAQRPFSRINNKRRPNTNSSHETSNIKPNNRKIQRSHRKRTPIR